VTIQHSSKHWGIGPALSTGAQPPAGRRGLAPQLLKPTGWSPQVITGEEKLAVIVAILLQNITLHSLIQQMLPHRDTKYPIEIECFTFTSECKQNALVGRALPGPAEGAYMAPIPPSCIKVEGKGRGRTKKGGKGEDGRDGGEREETEVIIVFFTPYTTFRPILCHYPSTQLKLLSSFLSTILFYVSYVCWCIGFIIHTTLQWLLFTMLLFCSCCFICRSYSYMDCFSHFMLGRTFLRFM